MTETLYEVVGSMTAANWFGLFCYMAMIACSFLTGYYYGKISVWREEAKKTSRSIQEMLYQTEALRERLASERTNGSGRSVEAPVPTTVPTPPNSSQEALTPRIGGLTQTLAKRLEEPIDPDFALVELGMVLGLWTEEPPKWVIASTNPLGDALTEVLFKLVELKVIVQNDDTFQVKWNHDWKLQ